MNRIYYFLHNSALGIYEIRKEKGCKILIQE
jgi:hypothetical protein